jgi:hypothetical protein
MENLTYGVKMKTIKKQFVIKRLNWEAVWKMENIIF